MLRHGGNMAEDQRASVSGPTSIGSDAPSTREKIKLFISYSHNSEEHLEWVKQLAERLESDGIEVVFDQQDLRIAMSPSSFMEDSLASCDRVLLIVTEAYTTKSNNLTGGVGYERMIITAEISKDLRTTRFIPLLRSGDKRPAFLADRLPIDARTGDFWSNDYQKLLSELRRPLEADGRPGSREASQTAASASENADAGASESKRGTESYHWSHDVHSHVGNTLYLIFVKFVFSGAKFKESVILDIEDSGISDYSTFELYATQDLLIRVWADRRGIHKLRKRLGDNRDVDLRHVEFMEANGVHHFPDHDTKRDHRRALQVSEQLTAAQIDGIQTYGADSELGERLIKEGVRIPDSVRFNGERIQFYIIIRALRRDFNPLSRVEKRMREFSTIKNKTFYSTTGTASEAVIKGQVSKDRYYDINDFVNAVTDALDKEDIKTETLLVAAEGRHGNGRIDPRRAETHLLEKEYKKLVGDDCDLSPQEDMQLLARYAEAAPAMAEDERGLLGDLIRLRAQGGGDNFDQIRTFFAELEHNLQKGLSPVILDVFGNKFDEAKKDLLAKEKIDGGPSRRLVLGDLLKIYRRLVTDHGIINIDPLSEDQFNSLMGEAPDIRNRLAHGVPEREAWERTFLFFQGFVRIDSRLQAYLRSIPSRSGVG